MPAAGSAIVTRSLDLAGGREGEVYVGSVHHRINPGERPLLSMAVEYLLDEWDSSV